MTVWRHANKIYKKSLLASSLLKFYKYKFWNRGCLTMSLFGRLRVASYGKDDTPPKRSVREDL